MDAPCDEALLTTKRTKATKVRIFLIINFVLFVSFVVQFSFSVAARRNTFVVVRFVKSARVYATVLVHAT